MSFKNYTPARRVVPATIALIVSVVLVFVIYLQVRFRWEEPEVTTTEQAKHSTTGMVVRNAGARLSPTEQKLSVEPDAPKTFQPADHPAPESAPR
jgi:hypothetical protein